MLEGRAVVISDSFNALLLHHPLDEAFAIDLNGHQIHPIGELADVEAFVLQAALELALELQHRPTGHIRHREGGRGWSLYDEAQLHLGMGRHRIDRHIAAFVAALEIDNVAILEAAVEVFHPQAVVSFGGGFVI